MLELKHDAPKPRHLCHKQMSPLGCNWTAHHGTGATDANSTDVQRRLNSAVQSWATVLGPRTDARVHGPDRSHGTWTTDSCWNARATALGPQHDEFNLCGLEDCTDIQPTNATALWPEANWTSLVLIEWNTMALGPRVQNSTEVQWRLNFAHTTSCFGKINGSPVGALLPSWCMPRVHLNHTCHPSPALNATLTLKQRKNKWGFDNIFL